MNQEQYEAAKSVLEAELADAPEEREQERLKEALATIERLVVADASE
jgi:hypothetical protein